MEDATDSSTCIKGIFIPFMRNLTGPKNNIFKVKLYFLEGLLRRSGQTLRPL